MLILIGYLIILLSVFGGFSLAGGHLAAIIQPVEFLIIAGAALGSLVVGNSTSVLKSIGKALPSLFISPKSAKTLYKDLLGLLYALMNKGRQEGFMSLENDVDDPANSPIFTSYPRLMARPYIIEFLCDYLRLMITSNMQPYQLESLMESEIETYHQEDSIPANAITKLADAMPAFGIVAAVLGVVHSMESINLPPSELGVLVAQALVGTFLGILLGYGFIGPLATAMEQRTNDMILMLNCIKVTLLASAHNYPPIIATEFGRKVLFSTARPSFNELNEEIKPVKQDASEEAVA
ncbi:flagellar motor stator protein MotA [Legionella jamestowniensis]|uniref:Flagellar motor protein MotA n=1 Tax=Legionella jamestowniensis TaxID=455 RepID=A0A0W0UWN5_9GAMM|nr:flagellar motor stator protein MotA [Legionella jamestowniensis]KTD12199.1 flagellar motor protein MotA [Legionella jamestowniensis]OCH96816.1 flagellar motor stator protein MotA [Legionella jamestowniensis]SFM02798.1 chemotaxis protein MotA [Legionella jamestowniensis DSM 19215]